MRGRSLGDVLQLLRALARETSTVRELAAGLEINVRSVYRSLAVLRSLGLLPVRTRVGQEIRWHLEWQRIEHWLRRAPIQRRAPTALDQEADE